MQEISRGIIQKASEGDANAFEVIYKEYFGFVSHVARRIINSREDVEDIIQEVFMNIYHNLRKFRFESSLKTWIYRITVNKAINYAKKLSRHHHQPMEYAETFIPETPSEIDHKINENFSENALTVLLDALNPDQRACIVLRSIEGLRYKEIAEVLKIPVNTVRSRIKRARETMLALRKRVVKDEM